MVERTSTPHTLLRYFALILGACLLIALSACGQAGSSSSGQAGSSSNGHTDPCDYAPCPAPEVWIVPQPNQTFASGTAGVFALRGIEINPKQYRFYYVFKEQQPHTTLRLAASDYLATDPSQVTPLATTNQVVGQIGSYVIGVAHIARSNRAGQVIMLQVTPVSHRGSVYSTWRLVTFKQLTLEPQDDTTWGGVNPANNALPEAIWSGEIESQKVSYFKVNIPGQPVAKRTYVFLRSDDPVVVKVITKAQFIAIAGANNFIP